MRLLFTPIGYDGGSNTIYYRDAERYLVDTLYSVMLERAVKQGKTQFVIFTGPSASGKSTVAKEMDFSETGLVYDAAFNSYKKLATAIKKAKRYGMKEIRLIAVYNTIRNCFKNSVDRGKTSKRFIHIPYMIESYGNNVHKMELLQQNFPDVEFICFDKSDNVNAKRVSMDDACKWNFNVSQDDIEYLFKVMLDEID
jgi:adenylate kinase family enzyme